MTVLAVVLAAASVYMQARIYTRARQGESPKRLPELVNRRSH